MTDERAEEILSRLPYGKYCQIETHLTEDGKIAQWLIVYGKSAVEEILYDLAKQEDIHNEG